MKSLFTVSFACIFVMSLCAVRGYPQAVPMAVHGAHNIDFLPVNFRPIQPLLCDSITINTSTGAAPRFFAEMKPADVNKLLPLQEAVVTVFKKDASGSLGFLTAKASAEKGEYQIFLDYIKYRDDFIETTGRRVLIGVGVRIQADVITTKANIDLGSIFKIGAAYSNGTVSGKLSVINIGVDSEKVSSMMHPPTDLSDTTLEAALQTASLVHAMLYDPSTTLTPYIVAVADPAAPAPVSPPKS